MDGCLEVDFFDKLLPIAVIMVVTGGLKLGQEKRLKCTSIADYTRKSVLSYSTS